jgi:hypothetical protein
MAANAPMGSKQSANLGLKFDLVNGTTGQAIGRFNERAFVHVEVGSAPDPAIGIPAATTLGNQASSRPETPQAGSQVPDRQPDSDPSGKPRQAGTHGTDGDTVPAPNLVKAPVVPEGQPEPSTPPAPDTLPAEPRVVGTDHSILIFGGGAVLLLVLVIALRHRR